MSFAAATATHSHTPLPYCGPMPLIRTFAAPSLAFMWADATASALLHSCRWCPRTDPLRVMRSDALETQLAHLLLMPGPVLARYCCESREAVGAKPDKDSGLLPAGHIRTVDSTHTVHTVGPCAFFHCFSVSRWLRPLCQRSRSFFRQAMLGIRPQRKSDAGARTRLRP